MGKLLIFSNSFKYLNENNVNSSLVKFIETFNIARTYKDEIFQDKLLSSFEFEFGNFYDFVYGSFEEIKKKPVLENLEQNIFQELQNLYYQIPVGGNEVNDINDFIDEYNNEHYGFLGLIKIEYECEENLKVVCVDTWINWSNIFFSENNTQINWEKHDFFPSIELSNYIITKEAKQNVDLLSFKKCAEISKKYCDEFDKNGLDKGQKNALAKSLGEKIAFANNYKHESEISTKESKRLNTLREIYSIEKNQRKIYLSIDFHKCFCFEVCDSNGEHLGELRFDGIFNGKNTQDKSGKHNIIIK